MKCCHPLIATVLAASAFVLLSTPVQAGDPPPPEVYFTETLGDTNAVAFDLQGRTVAAGHILDSGWGTFDWLVTSLDVNGTHRWSHRIQSGSANGGVAYSVASDPDGNLYAGGLLFGPSYGTSVDRPGIVAYSPEGSIRWTLVMPPSPSEPNARGWISEIIIDPDGVVYCCGMDGTRVFTASVSPLLGAFEWVEYRGENSIAPRLTLDTHGSVYVAYQQAELVGRTARLCRLHPFTGQPLWEYSQSTSQAPGDQILIESDLQGNLMFVFRDSVFSSTLQLRKLGRNGQVIWSADHTPPGVSAVFSKDGVLSRDGNFYGLAQTSTINGPARMLAYSLAPSGQLRWSTLLPTVTGEQGYPYCVALDRRGHAYISGSIRGTNGVIRGTIIKLTGDDGTPAWSPVAAIHPISSVFSSIAIDAGGDIVAAGDGVVRLDQTRLDVPEIYVNTFDVRIDQASIWDPALPSFLFEEPFGDGPICWNSSGQCAESVFFDALDEGASGGLFGISAEADTSGQLQFGFRAEATGGSVDIDYPGTAELIIPNQSKWVVGRTVSIETSWTPSAGAGIKGRGKPTINAGIVVSGYADLYANVRAWAPRLERTFIHLDRSFNLNPATYLISILGLGGGVWQNGMWVSACDPAFYVCGEWRVPPLDINGSLANGRLSSHAVDRFIDLRGNLTQILSLNLLGIPTILKYGRSAGGGGREGPFEVSVELSLIQAFIRAAFEAVQNISWEPRPKVRLVFSDPGFPNQPLINLGDEIEFPIPAGWDGTLEIRPEIVMEGAFRNQTGIRMIPTIGFDSLKAVGSVSTGPLSLSLGGCLGCFETPDPGIPPIFPYDRTISMPAPTKRLPVINVTGTALQQIWPVLTAASRETLPMVLYDQINPRQSSFNGIVNRTTKMLLYGNLFERGQDGDPDPVAFIRHAGAEAPLATTWLNVNTLLIEIPNRFRLIPGVARLTVRTTVGHAHRYSNTIDLPIEYPIPNLATVNPNLWAADPALRTVPVSVIDGLSSAGNHTFIARRDYYLVLRDQLWNASTAGGVGAAAYFPDFDFNAVPGFPAVMFGGVPLSRFEQPIDNGIHNVRLPEASYAAPGVVDVFLENPPPVQGLSQTVRLNIAAPRPVISGFEPPTVPPGEAFTLIVKGPANVPFWQGYEEPKYGNFTAASVVLWDGIELPTTFIHSGALQVEVPQEFVEQAGYHHITVETAAGGSVYFEQLRNGAGTITWQGPVPSGCSINAAGAVLCGSDPMVFAVEYPQPFIENVGPSTLDACTAAQSDQLSVDITIVGTGFAPDCRLFIDGAPRTVTRTSAELLQFTVASAEIAVPGIRSLYVENPGPYGGVSNEMTLEVVLTDCNANGRPDQCEINDGLAADCNGNRVPDSCDIARGDSADANGNGIPDECESGSPCRGDLDGDGDVDISDLATLLAHFGMPGGATASDGDSDADGDVDLSDLSVLLGSFGSPCE